MTHLELLESLTKEQLIAVIANYSDTFQDLSGWGLSDSDVRVMQVIGLASRYYCNQNDSWGLDSILPDLENN